MKIEKLIPGNRIQSNNKEKIQKVILTRINANNGDNYSNINSWKRVDNDIYESSVIKKNEDFYILYIHPIHEYMNKLFETKVDVLIEFMKKYINYERGDGIDIVIATKDFNELIVCNHDGEIFLL